MNAMSAVQQKLLTLRNQAELFQFDLLQEKRTQAQIEEMLTDMQMPYEREKRLGTGEIVDFLVDGIAVEIKIKGRRTAIYRQLERYARYPGVTGILLLTGLAMSLPPAIYGKPALMGSISRGWV